MTTRTPPPLCWVVLAAFFLSLPGVAADASSYSLLKPGNVKEYYSSNRDNRFLIKVHVWGDSPLTGVHYIPDNTTLLDLVGYTGGLGGGDFESAKISVMKTDPKVAPADRELKLSGGDLVRKPEYQSVKLAHGDIVRLENPPKSSEFGFLQTIGIISSVLGLITASATVYLLFKRN